MVATSSGKRDDTEQVVSFSKYNNRVSWFSDTDLETDHEEDVLVNGGPVSHYKSCTKRKRPYAVRYKEQCANKKTKKRALMIVLVIVFLSIIISLVYLYYSKTSLKEHTSDSFTRPLVKCGCGEVLGAVYGTGDKSFFSFKGIPYAEPPVGQRRWKEPRSLEESGRCWMGKYAATQFKSECAQIDFSGSFVGEEDCLYLNVLTPTLEKRAKLPVIVWIHGGDLQYLNGTVDGTYPNGTFVRKNRVVSITFNYRLNVFGFLALEVLSMFSKSNSSGNYGFMDQIQVLKWVRKNVEQFGGDPDAVTIIGDSSGGTSVFALLASPLSKELIAHAVALSGSALFSTTLSEASKKNELFIKKSHCSGTNSFSYQCLYNLTTKEALLAMPVEIWNSSGMDDIPVKGESYGGLAVIEPTVLPFPPSQIHLHSKGCQKRISVMIGTTAQETGLNPPVCFINKSSVEFTQYLKKRFDTFSTDLYDEVKKMYESSEKMEYQYLYESIASDIRVTCPNDLLAIAFSKSKCHNIYRYIVTNSPSHVIMPGTCKFTNAFHTWDQNALFGFSGIAKLFTPHIQDLLFMDTLLSELKHFNRYGHPLSSRWSMYPLSTANFANDGLHYFGPTGYHREQCLFFDNNGFKPYGWVN